MKILYILEYYKPHIWGVEILFENIIKWILEKWNEVKILTSHFDKKLPKYEKDWKLEIYRVWNNRYDFLYKAIIPWLKIAKDVDLIHTSTYTASIPAWIIWKLTNKKVILTVHEIFGKLWYRFKWKKWFFYKLFEDLIFKLDFTKYICVSNYTKNSLRIHYWIDDLKLCTIYNWLDYSFLEKLNQFKKDSYELKKNLWLENNYIWLFYWRSWITKWLNYFLQAIPYVVEYIKNFKAILIVSEDIFLPFDKIQKIIQEKWIWDYIILLRSQPRDKLFTYILMSDVVVLPSLVEWFGLAIAEVSVLWKNLVTTNVWAIPEVVWWKVNFVNPWDPIDLARWIINFYNWIYQEIPIKYFYIQDTINQYLNIYNLIKNV